MAIFKIVQDKKRTIKASCSGQVIETLKRATLPLTLTQLTQRVKGTKAGKALTIKDLKVRVRKCAEWYVNDENHYITKDEDGKYFLTLATDAPAE